MMENSIDPNRATIMFFEPARRFHDHYKRPYRFDIKTSHMERIDEFINDDRNRMTARGLMGDSAMVDMVSPTQDGYHVETSQLNQQWMFIAIIPDDEMNRSGITSLINKKYIMGYTTQEPFGRQATMAPMIEAHHINPACDLIVTKTIKTSDVRSNGADGQRRTISCSADYGCVNADSPGTSLFRDATVGYGTQENEIYGLDSVNFDRSLQDADFSSNGDIYSGVIVDDGEALHRKRSLTLQSSENSPVVRSQSFLTSLKHATRNSQINNSNQVFSDADYTMDDEHTISNDIRVNMANDGVNRGRRQREDFNRIIGEIGVQSGRLSFLRDNTVDSSINAGMFIRNTDCQIIYQQADRQHPTSSRHGGMGDVDIMPQNYTSKTTMYSSIIAAIVPTMMSSLGIASIGFRYDTENDVNLVDAGFSSGDSYYREAGKRGTRAHDMYAPVGPWSLIYPANDGEKIQTFRRFIDLFRMELVPILREAARSGVHTPGEFSVYVQASINGDTHVKLTFKDGDGYYKDGENVIYKDHTVLGGIVSPLLGRRNDLHHNVQAVKRAIMNSTEGVIDDGLSRDAGYGAGGLDDIYLDDELPRGSSFSSRVEDGYHSTRDNQVRRPGDVDFSGSLNKKINWE